MWLNVVVAAFVVVVASPPVTADDAHAANGPQLWAEDSACGSCKVSHTPAARVLPMVVGDTMKITISVEVTSEVKSKLDFYLLQDASGSFTTDMEKLKNLRNDIVAELESLSSDLIVGISTYSDRTEAASNWFKDHMTPMSADTARFKDILGAGLPASGGGDIPEAQLDGLFAIPHCPERYGWRPCSMRLLFLTTDAPFHQKGSTREWTPAKPNNLDCTMDKTEDYPSTEDCRKALQDAGGLAGGVFPVFAVHDRTLGSFQAYKDLVKEWGFGDTVELAGDSSNILAAIRNAYNAATLSVSGTVSVSGTGGGTISGLTHTLTLDTCPATKNSNRCSGLKDKDVVQYSLEVAIPAGTALSAEASNTTISVNLLGCTTVNFQILIANHQWVPGPWDPCDCLGIAARSVVCQDQVTRSTVPDHECDPATRPAATMPCPDFVPCFKWRTGNWTSCDCLGNKTRVVLCHDSKTDAVVLDVNCTTAMGVGPKPTIIRTCPVPSTCYAWHADPWGPCPCSEVRARPVTCRRTDTGATVAPGFCASLTPRPNATQICPAPVGCFRWDPGVWPPCPCTRRRNRSVTCLNISLPSAPIVAPEARCSAAAAKPATEEKCSLTNKEYVALCVPPVKVTVVPPGPREPEQVPALSDCTGGGGTVYVHTMLLSSTGGGREADLAGLVAAEGNHTGTGNHTSTNGSPPINHSVAPSPAMPSLTPSSAPSPKPSAGRLACYFGPQLVVATSLPGATMVYGQAMKRHVCTVPPLVLTQAQRKEARSGLGTASWGALLRIRLGDGTWHPMNMTFTYRNCCLPPPTVPLWPLLGLAPLAFLACCCSTCFIYVQRKQRLPTPPLLYAEPPEAPQPEVKVDTNTRLVERTVRKPKPKTPLPTRGDKKKKKWDQVATGTYLRDGAHMAVRWGKHGEAGAAQLVGGSTGDDDGSEMEEEEEERQTEELHETVTFEVEVPAALDVQMLQLPEPPSWDTVDERNQQSSRAGMPSKCPPCCSTALAMYACLAFVGAIAGVVLLNIWLADQRSDEANLCLGSNASAFCPRLADCAACAEALPRCEWCGRACRPASSAPDLPACNEPKMCPEPPPDVVFFAAMGLGGTVLLPLCAMVACCFCRRCTPRRGTSRAKQPLSPMAAEAREERGLSLSAAGGATALPGQQVGGGYPPSPAIMMGNPMGRDRAGTGASDSGQQFLAAQGATGTTQWGDAGALQVEARQAPSGSVSV